MSTELERVNAFTGHQLSGEFHEKVARIVSGLHGGIHNVPPRRLKASEWCSSYVMIDVQKELATWDGSGLTYLVTMCHDECVRCSVSPKTFRLMTLLFHPRKREGGMMERHPGLEEAMERIRNANRN